MDSRLYEGRLYHGRREGAVHRFTYRHACIYLRLDELDEFCRQSRWVSNESFNVLSFRRQDFLPSDRSLADEVIHQIREKMDVDFAGDIYMLANWRTLGVCMNPVTLFYCFEQSSLRYVVAEVHNTPWNERYVYVVDIDLPETEKAFHVSPFMPMDTTYHWRLPVPAESCEVGIRVDRGGREIFTATMNLQAREVTTAALNTMLARYPVLALSVLWGIYRQAFRLWWKKVPFFRHPELENQGEKSETVSLTRAD